MNDADFERAIRALAPGCDQVPLPDTALIWARAYARKRLETSERATRPIRLAESIIAAAAVAGAIVIFPASVFETLNPFVLRFFGMVLACVAAVSMLLLRLLLAEE